MRNITEGSAGASNVDSIKFLRNSQRGGFGGPKQLNVARDPSDLHQTNKDAVRLGRSCHRKDGRFYCLSSSERKAQMNEEQRTKNEEPSSNDVLVRVEGVSKIFCRSLKRSLHYGLMDSLTDILPLGKRKNDESGQPILRKEEFWAVKDVSFELRRGECLGLIGRNGAGKTTLLKMLNGLIKPDEGRIEMHGRVSALIALGAGFNPILTGRENIYVNGSILGSPKKRLKTNSMKSSISRRFASS